MVANCWSQASSRRQRLNIEYEAGAVNRFDFSHYLREIERHCQRYMRVTPQKISLKFTVVADFPEGIKAAPNEANSYLLSENLQRLYSDYDLNLKLLEIILLAQAGFSPGQLALPYPRWIIDGIYGKIHPDQRIHLMGVTRLGGLGALVAAGDFPQVFPALTNPLNPDRDGQAAYALFEELCVLTLDCSEQYSLTGANFLRMAELCVNSRNTYENILDQTLVKAFADLADRRQIGGAELDARGKMQLMITQYARGKTVNSLAPLSAGQTERALRNILKFSYSVQRGNKLLPQQAPLEEFPYVFKSIANRQEVTSTLLDAMNELRNSTTYPVAMELREIVKIIGEVNLGGRASAQTHSLQLREHIALLKKEINRQQLIEDRLTDLEIKHTPPTVYYQRELEEVRKSPEAFPEIARLLDKYENELQDFH